MDRTTKRWQRIAEKQLVGRKIASVRYLNDEEALAFGWDSKPLIMFLDDGSHIFPSSDDEGNDGGALFTSDEQEPTIPVMRI